MVKIDENFPVLSTQCPNKNEQKYAFSIDVRYDFEKVIIQ